MCEWALAPIFKCDTWNSIFHITLGVTAGSHFALFSTVNVFLFTSNVIFDGIVILLSLAMDWFDVGVLFFF